MATLKDRTAGGTTRGIPQAAVIAGVSMSHNGRQRFPPKRPETVQERKGQHQKP